MQVYNHDENLIKVVKIVSSIFLLLQYIIGQLILFTWKYFFIFRVKIHQQMYAGNTSDFVGIKARLFACFSTSIIKNTLKIINVMCYALYYDRINRIDIQSILHLLIQIINIWSSTRKCAKWNDAFKHFSTLHTYLDP